LKIYSLGSQQSLSKPKKCVGSISFFLWQAEAVVYRSLISKKCKSLEIP
jgi:hypothetical protein